MRPRLSAEVDVEVPFHDVDSMGVVWHGHYVKYLEIARTALLRGIDLDFKDMKSEGLIWPVVECHVKYIRPLRYGQRVRVRAELVEFEQRLKIGYQITDPGTGARLTKAHTVQLAVKVDTGELVLDLPKDLVKRIKGSHP